jgi:PhnB protein
MTSGLQPRLIVSGVDAAVAYYARALGAVETFRYTEPSGSVAHCVLTIDGNEMSMAERNDDYGLVDARHLGGSPVLIKLIVGDAVAIGERMVAAGGEVVVTIEDHGYGKMRDGSAIRSAICGW